MIFFKPFAAAFFSYLLLTCLPVMAEWDPVPPDPEEWDWIQLTSGEWLKGDIVVLYQDEFEFDSDELDTLTLDWEDIRQIRSGNIMQVRFIGNVKRKGQLIVDEIWTRFKGSDDLYNTSDIMSITAGDDFEANYWSVKYSLGINLRSGNSQSSDINSNLKTQRRTVTNRLVFNHLFTSSETDKQETANNQRANMAWDIFLTDAVFVRPIGAEYLKDVFQNIDYKYSISMGVGYQIIDTSKVDWAVVSGPGYQGTKFVTVQESADNKEGSLVFTTVSNLDIEISNDIDLYYDYSFSFVSETAGRYTHHMVTGLSIDLGQFFDLDLSLVWDRTERPQENELGETPKQDDYRLIVGLGFEY